MNIIKLTHPGLNPGKDSPMWINMDKVIKFENYNFKTEMWIEGFHSSIFIKETPEQIMKLIKGEEVVEVKTSNDLDLIDAMFEITGNARYAKVRTRTYRILEHLYKNMGIKTVQQLIEYYDDNDANFLRFQGCGPTTLKDIKTFIESFKEKE